MSRLDDLKQVMPFGHNEGEMTEGAVMAEARRFTADCALNALDFDNGRNVGFTKATEILKESGFDLEAAKKEEVDVHEKWGLIKAHKKNGIIRSKKSYERLWDKCRFSEQELAGLSDALKKGEKMMPVFNPGSFTLEELVGLLLKKKGIICGTECYGAQNYGQLREISLRKLASFDKLAQMDMFQRILAFREASLNSPDQGSANPSITFTPDTLAPGLCGKSPMELIYGRDRRFIDPVSDILRWRRQYDRCKNGDYPDRNAVTMYPQHVYDNGRIATLSCYENSLIFFLGDCRPDDSWEGLGARSAIAMAE